MKKNIQSVHEIQRPPPEKNGDVESSARACIATLWEIPSSDNRFKTMHILQRAYAWNGQAMTAEATAPF